MRKVKIEIEVNIDDADNIENIKWKSDDPPSNGQYADAKGFFLSLFDVKSLETLKIDLWTTKMEVGEMNRLCYFSFKAMADSYYKATGNTELANDVGRFTQYFGEETGILKKPN